MRNYTVAALKNIKKFEINSAAVTNNYRVEKTWKMCKNSENVPKARITKVCKPYVLFAIESRENALNAICHRRGEEVCRVMALGRNDLLK